MTCVPLIEPYGIEIGKKRRTKNESLLPLIEPYGIEITGGTRQPAKRTTFNRTLWN